MATVNFRVDEALKEKSYSVLREQGIAPTEFLQMSLNTLQRLGNSLYKKPYSQKRIPSY